VRIVVPDPRRGVWFGLANGGLARYQSGKFEILVKDIRARYLAVDKDGSVWAAGRNGLFRWREGTLKQLGTTNGLPCESIFAIIKDDADALWLYSACGLISISAAEIDRWWQEPDRKVLSRVFDALDGAQPSSSTFLPQVSKSPDGRLWFTNDTIIQTIDPRRLNDNRIVPPVHIEEVIADRKNYEARGALHLPAHTRDIEIDYTALSFRVPQKVRFRYKLDGRNPEWQDAGTRRQVFVSDLPPGWYKFHVIASNNDAVWNEAGASLDFYVAPAFYQTVWFRGASLAALLAFVAALYRARIRYLRDQFNLRLESRMNERTRIARDFHDTLLQSFQGVLLKFHAVVYMIPEQPDARMALENAMEDARNAIAEGRDAVQGLRSPLVVTEDFTRAITMLGEGLAATTGSDGPRFLVHVEGSPTDLAAGVRDEVYRVAGEGLRNAFRHASARRVEVDIHYDKRHFCVRVRDDGKGIDPQFLKGGREGHHGLKGMQERAKAVRGKLAIWSERDSGTEIELTIPAAFAYTKRLRRAPGGKGKLGEL
jgi:signal transduction histidine kinase